MRKYQQRNMTPPSGYYYIVPETALEIVAGDHDALVLAVQRHYVYNHIPVPSNLTARIEHFICLHNVPEFCKGEYEPDDRQTKIISVKQIKDVTRLIMSRATLGDKNFLVPPLEAERRAGVCARCPDNYRGICTTCNGLKEYVSRLISTRDTSQDHLLGVCAHCSCLLKAKVHVSAAALRPTISSNDLVNYPAQCWMHDITKAEES